MVHLPSLFPVSPLEMATFAAVRLPRTNTGKSCHNSPENGDHCLDIFSGLAAGTHFRNFCPDQGVRWTVFSIFQAPGTHFRNFCPDQRIRWTKFSIFQAPGTHFRNFCPDQRVRWTKFSIFQAPGTHFRNFCPDRGAVDKILDHPSSSDHTEPLSHLVHKLLTQFSRDRT